VASCGPCNACISCRELVGWRRWHLILSWHKRAAPLPQPVICPGMTQEYSYYYNANKDRLPRVPDLSDSSGGLSNRTYFNFVRWGGGGHTQVCHRVSGFYLMCNIHVWYRYLAVICSDDVKRMYS
jgi:hypothetical protein